MSVRNPKGTNSKRNPEWHVEEVKEVATSPAEEKKNGKRKGKRADVWRD